MKRFVVLIAMAVLAIAISGSANAAGPESITDAPTIWGKNPGLIAIALYSDKVFGKEDMISRFDFIFEVDPYGMIVSSGRGLLSVEEITAMIECYGDLLAEFAITLDSDEAGVYRLHSLERFSIAVPLWDSAIFLF